MVKILLNMIASCLLIVLCWASSVHATAHGASGPHIATAHDALGPPGAKSINVFYSPERAQSCVKCTQPDVYQTQNVHQDIVSGTNVDGQQLLLARGCGDKYGPHSLVSDQESERDSKCCQVERPRKLVACRHRGREYKC